MCVRQILGVKFFCCALGCLMLLRTHWNNQVELRTKKSVATLDCTYRKTQHWSHQRPPVSKTSRVIGLQLVFNFFPLYYWTKFWSCNVMTVETVFCYGEYNQFEKSRVSTFIIGLSLHASVKLDSLFDVK